MTLRRFASGLLAVLLLAAQVLCCEPTFVNAKGSECAKCLQIEHEPQGGQKELGPASHGDCHDCCVLKSCEGHARPVSKSPDRPFDVAFDLPIALAPFEGAHQSSEVVTGQGDRVQCLRGSPHSWQGRAPPLRSFA